MESNGERAGEWELKSSSSRASNSEAIVRSPLHTFFLNYSLKSWGNCPCFVCGCAFCSPPTGSTQCCLLATSQGWARHLPQLLIALLDPSKAPWTWEVLAAPKFGGSCVASLLGFCLLYAHGRFSPRIFFQCPWIVDSLGRQRLCLPSEKRAGKLTTCYQRSEFPKLKALLL